MNEPVEGNFREGRLELLGFIVAHYIYIDR